MVANAGVSTRAPAEEMTLEQWNRVIDIDLKGVFLCDREAGRYMLANGGGSIINMSSIIGIVGNTTGNSNYAAAKGGVSSLTKVMAVEWAQRGIRVNAIAPAQTATKLIEGLMRDNPATRKYFEEHIPMGPPGQALRDCVRCGIPGGRCHVLRHRTDDRGGRRRDLRILRTR